VQTCALPISRRRPRDPFRRRGSVGRRGRAADGGMMLDRILDSTRSRLPDLVMRTDDIVRQATEAPPPPPLAAALRGDTLTVIAEVKRRSPSRGPLDLDLRSEERRVGNECRSRR